MAEMSDQNPRKLTSNFYSVGNLFCLTTCKINYANYRYKIFRLTVFIHYIHFFHMLMFVVIYIYIYIYCTFVYVHLKYL